MWIVWSKRNLSSVATHNNYNILEYITTKFTTTENHCKASYFWTWRKEERRPKNMRRSISILTSTCGCRCTARKAVTLVLSTAVLFVFGTSPFVYGFSSLLLRNTGGIRLAQQQQQRLRARQVQSAQGLGSSTIFYENIIPWSKRWRAKVMMAMPLRK